MPNAKATGTTRFFGTSLGGFHPRVGAKCYLPKSASSFWVIECVKIFIFCESWMCQMSSYISIIEFQSTCQFINWYINKTTAESNLKTDCRCPGRGESLCIMENLIDRRYLASNRCLDSSRGWSHNPGRHIKPRLLSVSDARSIT